MKGFCKLHQYMGELKIANGKACFIQNGVHVQFSNQPIGPDWLQLRVL